MRAFVAGYTLMVLVVLSSILGGAGVYGRGDVETVAYFSTFGLLAVGFVLLVVGMVQWHRELR